MGVVVEPKYLRGYAAQLDDGEGAAWGSLLRYCEDHCRNTAGFDGLLSLARPVVYEMSSRVEGLVVQARRGMDDVAQRLRESADLYETADSNAAERILATRGRRQMPTGYVEQDVKSTATAFSAGPDLFLPPPYDYSDTAELKTSVLKKIEHINTLVRLVSGYDVLERLLPVIVGDSGALRRLAEAHRNMEHAIRAVKHDVESGMDLLSGHWTSDAPDGGASTAFDYQIRMRWIPALEAFAQANDACQQIYEAYAAEYDYFLNSVLFLLDLYFLRIVRLLAQLRFSTSFTQRAGLIRKLVMEVINLIEEAYEQLHKMVVMMIQGLEAVIALCGTVENMMHGDFRPFSAP
ncbi:hypothetical protein QEZ54_22260 [Catellatospora sp. KI3]|uniref:hypothetical protein n=1 Tax=Catellatospora sp. KI3 TaxID=3041620 RepID=UPI002482BA8B|nr:hypothetical protein [Catellatospora sp. KI3]MDI1463711.1 hypothetical protein [Catellatospora sp. KI3]